MTKEELEDDIYKLQKQYIKMKPKSIHRNPHYADGCAWAHFNSCRFKCKECMTFLMRECGIYGDDYREGRSARMNDLHRYRNYLKDFISGKVKMQYAEYMDGTIKKYDTEEEADKAMLEYINNKYKNL